MKLFTKQRFLTLWSLVRNIELNFFNASSEYMHAFKLAHRDHKKLKAQWSEKENKIMCVAFG